MQFLWFLIIGGIAGWIAGLIMQGSGFGIPINILVGIIGAVIGGWLFTLLGVATYGLLGSLITAVLGAVLLLFILSMFSRRPTV
jgi:uncharacterized membrane protein YeaQ/YmgE (transglycosylase-associated protein family)